MIRSKKKVFSIFFFFIIIASFSTSWESSRPQGLDEGTSGKRQHSTSPESDSSSPSGPNPKNWCLNIGNPPSTSKRKAKRQPSGHESQWQFKADAPERPADWFNEFIERTHNLFTDYARETERLEQYTQNVNSSNPFSTIIKDSIEYAESFVKSSISYFVSWQERKRDNVKIGVTATSSPNKALKECHFTVFVYGEMKDPISEAVVTPTVSNEEITKLKEYELYRFNGCGTFLYIHLDTTDAEIIEVLLRNKYIHYYVAAYIINFNVDMKPLNVIGVGLGANIASISMTQFRELTKNINLIENNLTVIDVAFKANLAKKMVDVKHSFLEKFGGIAIHNFQEFLDKVTLIFAREPPPQRSGAREFLKLCVKECIGTDPISCYIALREVRKVFVSYRSKFQSLPVEVDSAFSATESTGYVDVILSLDRIKSTIEKYQKLLEEKKTKLDLSLKAK